MWEGLSAGEPMNRVMRGRLGELGDLSELCVEMLRPASEVITCAHMRVEGCRAGWCCL